MKKIYSAIFMYMLFATFLYAQQAEDPFNWTKPIVIPSSIYVLWSDGTYQDSLKPQLNVYFSNPDGHAIEDLRADWL